MTDTTFTAADREALDLARWNRQPIGLDTIVSGDTTLDLGIRPLTLAEAFDLLDDLATLLRDASDGECLDWASKGRWAWHNGEGVPAAGIIALWAEAKIAEAEAEYYAGLDDALATGLVGEPFAALTRKVEARRAARYGYLKRRTGRRWS